LRKIAAAEQNSSGVIWCEINRNAAANDTVAADDEDISMHLLPPRMKSILVRALEATVDMHQIVNLKLWSDVSWPKLGETNMIAKSLLAALAVASLVAVPALAQTTANDPERNGHHYQGGPKTEVPHHMGTKETTGRATGGQSGGHHYNGGPATSTPHHMGDKK